MLTGRLNVFESKIDLVAVTLLTPNPTESEGWNCEDKIEIWARSGFDVFSATELHRIGEPE
jgi:hypothetical protein